jgi:hypothetical protein
MRRPSRTLKPCALLVDVLCAQQQGCANTGDNGALGANHALNTAKHMTKIGDVAQQAALIRMQMAARLASTKNTTGALDTHQQDAPSIENETHLGSTVSPDVLSAVRELHGQGDAVRKAAFRILLRQRIAKDLKLPLATTDPSVEGLVDDVLRQMEADKDLSESILVAGQALVHLSQQGS